jgi:hypothetical protein
MPWQPEDAPRHTHKADTPHLRRLWAEVANSVLAETENEGRAVRAGNAAVARARRRPSRGEPGLVERENLDSLDE